MSTKVPTLIIGLGGIGSEIVERIELRTQNKEKNYKKYVRDNIQFVIMDTDESSIRERRKNGYEGYCVSLSGDVSVGKCLEWDDDARNNWFPADNIFKNKSIAEGAGQVRAISRLAFQRSIRIGALTPLHDAIESLFQQSISFTEQELKVILVSTVAGGTGSGVFLPLAMYLKDYMKNKYSASEVKIDTCLILPEILESLQSNRNERNNLYSNGYAALKEVSYFMYKTDNNIRDAVSIKLPKEYNEKLIKHTESPFDFCFLFGRLTRKKRMLGTLEVYKEAIERCIYTQFIGAYSEKFFSVEDNMLVSNINEVKKHKEELQANISGDNAENTSLNYEESNIVEDANNSKRVKEDKKEKNEPESGMENETRDYFVEKRKIVLSRFASASCFKVYYPYEEIVEYLSLSWGLDIVSREWRKYDEEIRLFKYGERKKIEMGISGVERSSSEEFLNSVKRMADKEDKLSQRIISCEKKEKNITRFVEQFEKCINESIEQELNLWNRIEDEKNYLEERKLSKKDIRAFLGYYSELEKEIERIKETVTTNIEYELIKLHENEEEWKETFLEFYCKEERNGEWKSPNEIRYILSGIVEELTKKYESKAVDLKYARAEFNKYIKRENEIGKSDEMLKDRKLWKGWLDKKHIEERLSEVYGHILVNSQKVLRAEVTTYCYSKLREHIDDILKNYEKYFDEYENTRYYFEKRISDLNERFNDCVHGVEWLVYTNEKCTEKMKEKMRQKRVYYEIGGKVSEWIYKFCGRKEREKKEKQEELMKNMWIELFEQNYKKEFDFNLFDAFANEAECEEANDDIDLYIMQRLEMAEKDFSASLLTACRKDDASNRAWCIFSPNLASGMSYNKVKNHYFRSAKAIRDDRELDVDKRSIIFYQNRYGIESFMVDFAANNPGHGNTFPIGAGYESYYDIINRITGQDEKATLTPHIDNTWHRREIMPDMDREMEIEYIKWTLKIIVVKMVYQDKILGQKSDKITISGNVIEECIWNMQEEREEYRNYLERLANKGIIASVKNEFNVKVIEYVNLESQKQNNTQYLKILKEAVKRAEEELTKEIN